ncbi:MAG TPA: MBL fold metallo-hydrolase [Verrucomicrobiae bacterium]
MRITNLNPDDGIGASGWLLEVDGCRLLMDAGMHPKREGRDALPLYNLLNDSHLDAVAITHCHHDHLGSLPVAMRHARHARILMTELSCCLAGRVLHNSVNVMIRQRDERGVREYPLFTHEDAEEVEAQFQGFRCNRPVDWASDRKGRARSPSPSLEFFDAGHTLGSAGILVRGQSQSLFYTGDVCFHDQTILQSARFDGVRADILIMETTRGNRAAPPGFTRQKEIERLTAAMQGVLSRRGSVLMPAFALGRTQEMLASVALMMRTGQIARQPVYVGGLGRVFTEIYDQKAHLAERQWPNLQLTEELQVIVLERDELHTIKLGAGRIFILTAGMLTEATPAHDLALRMMEDPRQAIFFVGYADPDTPGGRLKASKTGQPFIFSAAAGEVTPRCQVEEFDLTAHADREALLDFAVRAAPRVILLGHGEAASRQWFEEQLRARLPGTRIVQPSPGLAVEA